jgi:hypothetical protein
VIAAVNSDYAVPAAAMSEVYWFQLFQTFQWFQPHLFSPPRRGGGLRWALNSLSAKGRISPKLFG